MLEAEIMVVQITTSWFCLYGPLHPRDIGRLSLPAGHL